MADDQGSAEVRGSDRQVQVDDRGTPVIGRQQRSPAIARLPAEFGATVGRRGFDEHAILLQPHPRGPVIGRIALRGGRGRADQCPAVVAAIVATVLATVLATVIATFITTFITAVITAVIAAVIGIGTHVLPRPGEKASMGELALSSGRPRAIRAAVRNGLQALRDRGGRIRRVYSRDGCS
ncbi:MAG: hypothetical protein QM766_14380 [Burkholderiaceae bacterium]